MALTIRPTGEALGARVAGLDCGNISVGEARDLYGAFLEYGVLVFSGIMDVADQIALSKVFGEMQPPHEVGELRHAAVPGIRELAANGGKPVAADDPDADKIIGQIPWHTDKAYVEVPTKGALLRAVVIPEEGGYTGWIDTTRVYRALPTAIKRRIQNVRIIHSFDASHKRQSMVQGGVGLFPDAIRPLVSVHPETDQPVLNISPATAVRLVGLSDAEGTELLDEIIGLATNEAHAYVHNWQPGDLVAWDNLRMIHRAYGHRKRFPRVMNSLQIKGEMTLGELLPHDGKPSGQAAA
jgi:taurine dioxygenase